MDTQGENLGRKGRDITEVRKGPQGEGHCWSYDRKYNFTSN